MNTLGEPIEEPDNLQYWYDGDFFPGLPEIMEIVKTAPERILPSIQVCHFRAVRIDEDAIREAIREQHHEGIFDSSGMSEALSSLVSAFNKASEIYHVGTYFPAREIDPETRAELQRELDEHWKEIDE